MFCSNCGKSLADTDKFCISCGNKVAQNQTAPQSQIPEYPAYAPPSAEQATYAPPSYEPLTYDSQPTTLLNAQPSAQSYTPFGAEPQGYTLPQAQVPQAYTQAYTSQPGSQETQAYAQAPQQQAYQQAPQQTYTQPTPTYTQPTQGYAPTQATQGYQQAPQYAQAPPVYGAASGGRKSYPTWMVILAGLLTAALIAGVVSFFLRDRLFGSGSSDNKGQSGTSQRAAVPKSMDDLELCKLTIKENLLAMCHYNKVEYNPSVTKSLLPFDASDGTNIVRFQGEGEDPANFNFNLVHDGNGNSSFAISTMADGQNKTALISFMDGYVYVKRADPKLAVVRYKLPPEKWQELQNSTALDRYINLFPFVGDAPAVDDSVLEAKIDKFISLALKGYDKNSIGENAVGDKNRSGSRNFYPSVEGEDARAAMLAYYEIFTEAGGGITQFAKRVKGPGNAQASIELLKNVPATTKMDLHLSVYTYKGIPEGVAINGKYAEGDTHRYMAAEYAKLDAPDRTVRSIGSENFSHDDCFRKGGEQQKNADGSIKAKLDSYASSDSNSPTLGFDGEYTKKTEGGKTVVDAEFNFKFQFEKWLIKSLCSESAQGTKYIGSITGTSTDKLNKVAQFTINRELDTANKTVAVPPFVAGTGVEAATLEEFYTALNNDPNSSSQNTSPLADFCALQEDYKLVVTFMVLFSS